MKAVPIAVIAAGVASGSMPSAGVSGPSLTVAFPGAADAATSPDGRSAVINEDRDERPHHRLYMIHDGETRLLLAYGRHVDVSWSPDSSVLFVNDHAESNAEDCIVIARGPCGDDPCSRRSRKADGPSCGAMTTAISMSIAMHGGGWTPSPCPCAATTARDRGRWICGSSST